MAQWKRVLTADDVTNTNIGSANLTIPNSTNRSLTLGNSSSEFQVKNSSNVVFFRVADDECIVGAGNVHCERTIINSGGSKFTVADDNTASFSLTKEFRVSMLADTDDAGPVFVLSKSSGAAPGLSDNDLIGQIKFKGDSDPLDPDLTVPTEVEYANIQCIARDTDATYDADGGGFSENQDGKLQVNVAIDGTPTPALTIDGQALHLHAEIEQHTFRLTSNETNGGTASPVIDLFSDSGSSAVGDHIGEIRFRSDNGNSDPKTFADITAKIADPGNNSEDGEINFNVIADGALTEAMSLNRSQIDLKTSGPVLKLTGSSNRVEFSDTDDLVIESQDTGSTLGSILDLYRNSVSPVNYNYVGYLQFSGKDSQGNKTTYGRIRSRIRDVTSGAEDGIMEFLVSKNGAMKQFFGVDGNNLDIDLYMSGDTFKIESHDSGSGDSPVIELRRDTSSPADGDDIGVIRFRADNSSNAVHTFAELEVEADDVTDDVEDGQIKLRMSDNGVLTEVLRFDVIDPTTTSVTDNQNKLKNVFIRGASLHTLTNKFMHTFMFGSNDGISNDEGDPVSVRLLRTVNGINMGTTSNTLDMNDADLNNGIIMPFDGFLRAGSLSFQKTGGTQATVKLKAAILRSANTNTNQIFELASTAGANSNKTFPRAHGYVDIHTESDGTDNVNKFVAGDKLVVYVEVDATTTDTTYTADNFIASVTIYSEDYG